MPLPLLPQPFVYQRDARDIERRLIAASHRRRRPPLLMPMPLPLLDVSATRARHAA